MINSQEKRIKRWALHSYRVGVFIFIVAMIRVQHRWFVAQQRGALNASVTIDQVSPFYPKADSLSDWSPDHGGQVVVDRDGNPLGYVVQTLPVAENVIGFSGPTNTLIAFNADDRILGVSVLHSGDTREHLADIVGDKRFMAQFDGLSWDEAGRGTRVDGVSGATLTSMSIADGIAMRLSGAKPSSRFQTEIGLAEIRSHFAKAQTLKPSDLRPELIEVLDDVNARIGFVARTSPHADNIIGFQGPTDTLILLDKRKRITGFAIRESFDNQPYVRYVKEDKYFQNTFVGLTLDEVSLLDLFEARVEGVSGATMTSMTVAETLVQASKELTRERGNLSTSQSFTLTTRNIGTMLVVMIAMAIAFSHLRGNRRLRLAFQFVLVFYLGFVNADMVSQALLVGWAQNGIAWSGAPGLAVLTLAAFIAPVFTGRQVYCTHICPHGAVQDWLRRRLPYRVVIKRRHKRLLKVIPVGLLFWVVLVAMQHLAFSLVGIEPFDAYVIRVAGWATLSVAVVSLVASLFVSKAYCHYGCPTGALLEFLRLGAASARFGSRDVVAGVLALIALGLLLFR